MSQDQLYQKAMHIVAGRRQQAVTQAQRVRAQVDARLPQLSQIENERLQAGLTAANLAAIGAPQAQTNAALAAVSALDTRINELLVQNGLHKSDLQPHYTCARCNDTGRANGAVCTCVHALVRELRGTQVNEASPLSLCSFASFDVNKYPETLVPALGLTARAQMQQILDYCKAYAEHFTLHSDSLYLCGYAGLGKTHLALSIANEVLQKDFDVVYVSAQEAFDRVEKERFSGGGETMETLLRAQLLILDDLGTEYISPYISACLYSLVNTRCSRRLPTIYTSNIVSDADLRRRYTEKIVSRLLGSCEVLSFCGEDIRLMEK